MTSKWFELSSTKQVFNSFPEQKGQYSCEQSGCSKVYSGRKALKKHMMNQHNIILKPGKSGRPMVNSDVSKDITCGKANINELTQKAIIIKHLPGTKTVTGSVRKEYVVDSRGLKSEKPYQKRSISTVFIIGKDFGKESHQDE